MMNKYFKIIFNRLNHNLIYHYSSFLSLVGCGLTVIIGFVGIYYVGTSSAAVVLGLTLSFLVSFFVHYNINYSDNLFIKIIQLLIANIFIFIIVCTMILFFFFGLWSHVFYCDSIVDVIASTSNNSLFLIGVSCMKGQNRCFLHSVSDSKILGNDKIKEKIDHSLSCIAKDNLTLSDKLSIYGSYENYLNSLMEDKFVTEEFIASNYPDLIGDDRFKLFINELYPTIRTEVKFVLNIYESITKLNLFIDRIVLLNNYLSKDLILKLLDEFKDTRKHILDNLIQLGYEDSEKILNKLLIDINQSLKNKLFLEKSTISLDNNQLREFEDFRIFWIFIESTMKKDVNLNSNYNSETISDYTLEIDKKYKEVEDYYYHKIVKLIKFIELNNIFISQTKNLEEWLDKYRNDIIVYSKTDKSESYTIKKGKRRIKKMSGGRVIYGYSHILQNMNKELENMIIKHYNDNYNNETRQNDLIKNTYYLSNQIQKHNEVVEQDFNDIYKELTEAFNINKFILDISRNLNNDNLNEQYIKLNNYFEETFKNNNITHDQLIDVFKAIQKYNMNYFRIDDLSLKRENNLSLNSFLYIKCREIISDQRINLEHKQTLLEKFILSYEKEFTLNIIKNMDSNVTDFKLLTRIYKHSTPQFINRIQIFIENNKKNNYTNYLDNKDNISKLGDHLVLALFLTIESNQLVNIIFSKVVRLIGLSGGITQNELLGGLSDEMFILFKYNVDRKEKSIEMQTLSKEEINLINDIKNKLIDFPIESKYKFGDLLLELILDEFSYIFVKNNLIENGEHRIYISIKPEYLSILTGSIFNPIKLPMIAIPKEWSFDTYGKNSNKVKEILKTGGYYLSEFNELSKNNNIIRQHIYNKYDSVLSVDQIDTINFLNKIPFEINKDVLKIVVKEWDDKDNSILFNGLNRLHPKSDDFDKVKANIKREILSHNSKHWTYANIINIALLMKDHTIYFPTFLDFRGRIYPTPNYLSYQSNDLARSLLLFKNILSDSKHANKDYYSEVLYSILSDNSDHKINVQSTKLKKGQILKKKDKKMILENKNQMDMYLIDYFKLYLANVFGKNKLTRKGKIKWFDQNIGTILEKYKNNFSMFINEYVKISKEPFQFLACVQAYYNYIHHNNDIKVPILFDASCSGIQHLSALTTDLNIAKLVNLLDNDEPSDFYQYCLDQLVEVFKLIPYDGKLSSFKEKVLQLKINRSWLKHSIMTIPYNVTDIGISDKLSKHFNKIFVTNTQLDDLNNGKINLNDTIKLYESDIFSKKIKSENLEKGTYIYVPKSEILSVPTTNNPNMSQLFFTSGELITFSHYIKTTVLNIIPPFTQLKNYFDKMIDILKKLELPIFWETPSGMSVSMSNRVMKSKQIKTSLIKKAKPINILLPTDQIDYKNIKTGLMPNFIHSLDASNIHILIKNILRYLPKQNINLYTIHDCFASDYKNIGLIELLVKHSFVELYFKKNYLEMIHNSFIHQISAERDIFKEESPDNTIINYLYIVKTNKKGILEKEYERINIPNLPDYNWDINKKIIQQQLLFNSYFIS